uniref:Sushi domain-containing protein n=1 Tax=Macrostomum lignano TaxID=282301 RepID=A0A1I8JQ75_9PLAT
TFRQSCCEISLLNRHFVSHGCGDHPDDRPAAGCCSIPGSAIRQESPAPQMNATSAPTNLTQSIPTSTCTNSSNPDSPVNTVGSHVNITCKAGWGFVFETATSPTGCGWTAWRTTSRCANVTIDLGQYLYNSSDPNGLSTAFGSHVNVIGAGAYFENSSQAPLDATRLRCEEGKGWSRTFFTGGDSQPQSVQPTELLGSIQPVLPQCIHIPTIWCQPMPQYDSSHVYRLTNAGPELQRQLLGRCYARSDLRQQPAGVLPQRAKSALGEQSCCAPPAGTWNLTIYSLGQPSVVQERRNFSTDDVVAVPRCTDRICWLDPAQPGPAVPSCLDSSVGQQNGGDGGLHRAVSLCLSGYKGGRFDKEISSVCQAQMDAINNREVMSWSQDDNFTAGSFRPEHMPAWLRRKPASCYCFNRSSSAGSFGPPNETVPFVLSKAELEDRNFRCLSECAELELCGGEATDESGALGFLSVYDA